MTSLLSYILKWNGYIKDTHLPLMELLNFSLAANFSVVGMNVSLMWNSVGFYQVRSSHFALLCPLGS
jgi:hypothetical protein